MQEVPENHCWLLCDNESIPGSEAVDSRRFGPVSTDHIVGRVIYSCASLFDHGKVSNRRAEPLASVGLGEVKGVRGFLTHAHPWSAGVLHPKL